MCRKQLLGLIAICLMLVTTSSEAYSNDPSGKIFIERSFGDFSNCGPISALMLAKYINSDFKIKNLTTDITKARKIIMKDKARDPSNRWWRMSDIKKYLGHMSVKYNEIRMGKKDTIRDRRNKIISQLNQGSVALINVNMNDLPKGTKVGKAYITFPLLGKAWGHFLVIVGYKEVNGQIAFETHDSYTEQGRNRLFYADNIVKSINQYNPEVIFVSNTHTMDNLWASEQW